MTQLKACALTNDRNTSIEGPHPPEWKRPGKGTKRPRNLASERENGAGVSCYNFVGFSSLPDLYKPSSNLAKQAEKIRKCVKAGNVTLAQDDKGGFHNINLGRLPAQFLVFC